MQRSKTYDQDGYNCSRTARAACLAYDLRKRIPSCERAAMVSSLSYAIAVSSAIMLLFYGVVLLLVAVLWVLWLAWTNGFFASLAVRQEVVGPFLVLYKEVVGPYSDINKHFRHVHAQLIRLGLIHTSEVHRQPMLGVYYDNPRQTPGPQCRASVCYVFKSGQQIIKPADMEKFRSWLNNLTIVKTGDLKVGAFPACRCLVLNMPLRGMLSIMAAVTRGYPKLQQALQARMKDGKPLTQFQGSLEVYRWANDGQSVGNLCLAYPMCDPKTDLMPFPLPPSKEAKKAQ